MFLCLIPVSLLPFIGFELHKKGRGEMKDGTDMNFS